MENGRDKAAKLAQELGCNIQTSRELTDCLRHRPAKMIVEKLAVFAVSIASNSEKYKCGLHGQHAKCSCRGLTSCRGN
jgi:Carboxylesterase.